MRTFKIHSLSNFQICNTLLLTIVTMLYVTPPWLIYYWKFGPFESLLLFGPHPHSLPLAATSVFSVPVCLMKLMSSRQIPLTMNPKLATVHPWDWRAHEGLSSHWLLLKWTQYLQALFTGKWTHLVSKERKVHGPRVSFFFFFSLHLLGA